MFTCCSYYIFPKQKKNQFLCLRLGLKTELVINNYAVDLHRIFTVGLLPIDINLKKHKKKNNEKISC